MRRPPPGFRWLIPLVGCLAVLAAPTPAGLTPEGQRVLAVIVLAIGLWGLEAVPSGVTAIIAIVALVGTGAVAGIREGLAGPLESGLRLERALAALVMESREAQHGLKTFSGRSRK